MGYIVKVLLITVNSDFFMLFLINIILLNVLEMV